MIRFEEITNKNIWKVCMLEPFEEQKDFVAENIQSLAEAYATRNEGNNAFRDFHLYLTPSHPGSSHRISL